MRINLLDELIAIPSGSSFPSWGWIILVGDLPKLPESTQLGEMLGRLQCSASHLGVGEAESLNHHLECMIRRPESRDIEESCVVLKTFTYVLLFSAIHQYIPLNVASYARHGYP